MNEPTQEQLPLDAKTEQPETEPPKQETAPAPDAPTIKKDAPAADDEAKELVTDAQVQALKEEQAQQSEAVA